MLLRRATTTLAAAPALWQCIPRACIWRGRDDPTGELAPRIEDVNYVLSGPLDNRAPTILPRCVVDQMIDDEYAELYLHSIWARMGDLKLKSYRYNIRKYKTHYLEPVYPPVYGIAFKDPTLPLTIDIGSGRGYMIMLMAKRNPHRNFLGLEKRSKRVQISQRIAETLGLTNVHFVLCNATISLEKLLTTYPGPLTLAMVVCPDPHVKLRFIKIRMVKQTLIRQILRCLAPGGKLFIQSEFEEVADYIRKEIDCHVPKYLSVVDDGNIAVYDEAGWLLMNPIGVRSDVEIDAIAHGEKIYRRYYERLDRPYASRIPYWLTLPKSDIESPLPLLPRKYRVPDESTFKPYGRRMCRMIRKGVPGADIILNGECYPKWYFKRMLRGPLLKYQYRTRERLLALERPLDPRYAKFARPKRQRGKKPLQVYQGWKDLYKM